MFAAMSLSDRIAPLCDLLLGAAHADHKLEPSERRELHDTLADLAGGELPKEIEEQIDRFDPKTFDLDRTAAAFATDSEDERRRLLFLAAAINDAKGKADTAAAAEMQKMTSTLPLPPGFKLPF